MSSSYAQHLPRELRRRLESTVRDARNQASAGARAALEHLGVPDRDAPAYLSPDEAALRKELRARARQLGDVRDTTGEHGFARLIHACAYEHWHRMLFARFLAERGLLIHSSGIAVTLADCEELAREEGARNGWELAGQYAAQMLPQIFRPDDPLLRVALPTEYEQALERLLAGLDPAVFQAKDALGWVYQFWQAQKKKEVNDSEVKIGADELPAVTQLFTEPYMVQFLLHNTLGAWWAGKLLAVDETLATTAADEAALRDACALPGVDWTYLRFVQEEGRWRPASGTFDGWPKHAKEILALDPCCGSGHFLVGMLEILTALRAAEEGLDVAAACDAVLRDNLHGLEIDPRCTELAAFAVALAAWSLPRVAGVRPLPPLKIACSGLSMGVDLETWREFASDEPQFGSEISDLWRDFENAPVLGSLIQPHKVLGDLFAPHSGRLLNYLRRRAKQEQSAATAETRELAVTALGAATAAELLSGRYDLVATNVPYLGRGKQDEILKVFSDRNHKNAKGDLATSMIERCLAFCTPAGSTALVTPQNWLFLGTYEHLRRELLRRDRWDLVARLGSRAFETITGEVVNAALVVLSDGKSSDGHTIAGIDVASAQSPSDKASGLRSESVSAVPQIDQSQNPNSVITFQAASRVPVLEKLADAPNGSHGGDSPRHRRVFWEMLSVSENWRFFQGTVESTREYGGREHLFSWFDSGRHHRKNPNAYIKGENVWRRPGVVISMIGDLPATLYTGEIFDISCTPIVPQDAPYVTAIWAFCSSPQYREEVRRIDQKMNVTNATLAKVPFDLAHWTAVAAEKYPNGLPKPHSDDPTQWLFDGHPRRATQPLQVAVARLCGYRWPRQTGSDFPDCPALGPDGLESLVDNDGIVCLSAVAGERPAADRVVELLAAAYGADWSDDELQRLLTGVGYGQKTLEAWLETAFFEQHCKLFQHRPFIWHIWDGVRGGFSALVHYHRLDYKTLEKLTYTYLGDWITRQEHGVRGGTDGAKDRLAAAQNLQRELEKILAGEKPYDIFVRWKPLDKQPVGWNPDLDDGVRLNIRPFLLARDVGSKGAGVLRWKPNVHWKSDRGQDVQSAPWYGMFQGERVNDHHLALAEKTAGRPEQ